MNDYHYSLTPPGGGQKCNLQFVVSKCRFWNTLIFEHKIPSDKTGVIIVSYMFDPHVFNLTVASFPVGCSAIWAGYVGTYVGNHVGTCVKFGFEAVI